MQAAPVEEPTARVNCVWRNRLKLINHGRVIRKVGPGFPHPHAPGSEARPMELETDLKTGAVGKVLKERAAELKEEFLSRLQQLRIDLVKAREQILFLERGCDAAEAAMERAKVYSPVIAKAFECPNCYVRMGIAGILDENRDELAEHVMTCRKCGTRFRIPDAK